MLKGAKLPRGQRNCRRARSLECKRPILSALLTPGRLPAYSLPDGRLSSTMAPPMSSICTVCCEPPMVRVLYDDEIFSSQTVGGVSRYFTEVISLLENDADISISLPLIVTANEYIRACES